MLTHYDVKDMEEVFENQLKAGRPYTKWEDTFIGPYVVHEDVAMAYHAWKLCKGRYQRSVIVGDNPICNSTLSGLAYDFKMDYNRSVKNLLKRMTDAGILWSTQVAPGGERILVIGLAPYNEG